MRTQQEIEAEIDRINALLDKKSTTRIERTCLLDELRILYWVLEIPVALGNKNPTRD